MNAPGSVTLKNGCSIEGRPHGDHSADMFLCRSDGTLLDRDRGNIAREAVRQTVATRFVQKIIDAGIVTLAQEPVPVEQRPEIVAARTKVEAGKPKRQFGDPTGEYATALDQLVNLQAAAQADFEMRTKARAAALGAAQREIEQALLQLSIVVDAERVAQTAAKKAGVQGQGKAITFSNIDPWPELVDGAALLESIAAVYSRYLVLPDGAAEVLALWTTSTYAIEHFEHTGYIGITSPTKGCGKTTALDVAKPLVHRGLSAGDISPASVFRVVESMRPTLILDELDRVHRDSDLWGVVNTGHTRSGAVIRTVGDDNEPRTFSTYCAKAVAYIRKSKTTVPDTTESRCIRITLQRKRRSETREKLRTRAFEAVAALLRRQITRWVKDNTDALAAARPVAPEELDDRAADCWEALLAVADVAGGQWPALARRLAVEYGADRVEDERDGDVGVLLLADLGDLITSGTLLPDEHGFSSETIVNMLHQLPDRPWCTWGKSEKPMTEHALGRLLRPFGVRTERVGPEHARVRRYPENSFREAIERMSTSVTPAPKRTSGQAGFEQTVSSSSETAVRMDASEADSSPTDGNCKASDGNETKEPQDELVLDFPDPSVYHHQGKAYRPGDRLPDGREVLAVDDGVPTLSKRLGGDR